MALLLGVWCSSCSVPCHSCLRSEFEWHAEREFEEHAERGLVAALCGERPPYGCTCTRCLGPELLFFGSTHAICQGGGTCCSNCLSCIHAHAHSACVQTGSLYTVMSATGTALFRGVQEVRVLMQSRRRWGLEGQMVSRWSGVCVHAILLYTIVAHADDEPLRWTLALLHTTPPLLQTSAPCLDTLKAARCLPTEMERKGGYVYCWAIARFALVPVLTGRGNDMHNKS